MMKYVPYYNAIIAKQIAKGYSTKEANGLTYKAEELPIYEVQAIGTLSSGLELSVGDKVVTNSVPTKLDDDMFLIREEYVAGKIAE